MVVSVQPSHGQDSAFSSHLKTYAGRKDRGAVSKAPGAVPEVNFNHSDKDTVD